MKITSIFRSKRFSLAAGGLQWLATFFLERRVFEVPPTEDLLNYIPCKLLALLALVAFWELIRQALLSPERRESPLRQYLLYALPCLGVTAVWLVCNHPFVLTGDELNLYRRAVRLDSFAYWFNYPSGWYWITSLMILPHPMGPVVIKVFLQSLTAGYCVARQSRITGKSTGWLIYLLFCIPFVLDQGISAHRLPIYGLLYLFFAAKLLYDRLERKPLTLKTLILLSAVAGLLAIWRSEGIYMLPLGGILLFTAYRLKWGKPLLKPALIYLLILALIALPQLREYQNSQAGVSLRTEPLCGYALCNMFRNGLTEDMVSEEREDIEGYLKLSTVAEYNETYGDLNYKSALIMEGTEEADYAARAAFCSAVKGVALRHPLIYLRSQWNAWRYVSSQYPLDFSQGFFQSLRLMTYRVWLPCALVLLTCVLALLRRKWLVFWLSGGALANWVIVFLLMPAAYPKYFYVDYLLGYFFALAGLCFLVRRGRHEKAA